MSSGIVIVGGMHWRFFSLLRSPCICICPWLLVPLSALQDLHVDRLLLAVTVQLLCFQGRRSALQDTYQNESTYRRVTSPDEREDLNKLF